MPGDLTEKERNRLAAELPYYEGPQWVEARSRPTREGEPIRSIFQTDAGTLAGAFVACAGGRRVRQALIVGDFFTIPGRLIHDLEASLVGVAIERSALTKAVLDFFGSHDGRILGILPAKVAAAVAAAADRLVLLGKEFTHSEANDLFLLNLSRKNCICTGLNGCSSLLFKRP